MNESEERIFQTLTTAINKAVNNIETPVKQKHVRSTIIGTFHDKGAQTFWIVVLRLPLQEDRIVAWKFCHVLHKLLREGHPATIQHSQRHRDELENLGKLWVHLNDCYGKLIRLYCNLLITKLDFHRKNPRFPGNLSVTHSELEAIGENDINNYFQMSVEMFDYMDNILELQSAIFSSIDRSRSNSMTSSGQCRLSPLIPCIQDASKLYDFCVKLLFKLHSTLPPDTLSGHRERFLKQFRDLKLFYQNSNALQYFRNLITIPSLPENPPNFLIQAELRTYVTPVVIIPPEEPEIETANEVTLIDTSHDMISDDSVDSTNHNDDDKLPSSHFIEIIAQRDQLIDHLQKENKNLRLELQKITKEHQKTVIELEEQITAIETELATRESELVQERQLKEDLFQQATNAAQSQDSEQKLKEEKFLKLKELYMKLREEHIQLIRQKAEVEKKLTFANKNLDELEHLKTELETKIIETTESQYIEHERIQQSANEQLLELDNLKKEHDTLASENSVLNLKIERLIDDKSLLERNLEDMKKQNQEQSAEISIMTVNTSELNSILEQLKKDFENTKIECNKVNFENMNLISKFENLEKEKHLTEKNLEDVNIKKNQLDEQITILSTKITELLNTIEKLKQDLIDKNRQLLFACIRGAENIMQRAIDEVENPALSAVTCTPDYFRILTESSLNALNTISTLVTESQSQLQNASLLIGTTKLAHVLAVYLVQGRATSNTSPDIIFGEQMTVKCKQLGSSVLEVLQSLRETGNNNGTTTECVEKAKHELEAMSNLVETLRGTLEENSAEILADMVDSELLTMEKNIEETAKRIQDMLSKSRAADSGLKLEVNEKILDSCTKLMHAIRLLVNKSRLLQAEIVAQGKGSASAKEFYKRNHRWTDGLISAAKAVGIAATFLLTSADKVVTSQGKLEQLIVAAQEIAASTAQLVVASRVKADRNSNNLHQVTNASKGVSNATGEVVATVKNCSQLMDDADSYDTSHLTLHAAKRQEMDTQIRVLELEKELEQNRTKLLALRRHHYQLAGESEGWDTLPDLQ